jgi:competence protein ComEA
VRVLVLAVGLILPLLWKSRTPPSREQAAFLHYSTGFVLLKISGSGNQDGIHRVRDGVMFADVKKMAEAAADGKALPPCRERRVRNGDAFDFGPIGISSGEISQQRMTVAEMVLLGIPLDADMLSAEDWESLPGVGPSLARMIFDDRQKNGRFGGLEGIMRVPGIGPGKIQVLRRYF